MTVTTETRPDTPTADARPRRTPTGGVRVSSAARCRCGQALDCCGRHHCPRCGRTIAAG